MATSVRDFGTDMHGWSVLLPERQAKPSLSNSRRVAWAVVGAGVTGLACARRLAELHPGEEILLLEARLVGQGASGRNSGFSVGVSHFPGALDTARLDGYRRVNRINQFGLDLLRSQVSGHQIDCQWYEGGFYHAAADRQALVEFSNFLPKSE